MSKKDDGQKDRDRMWRVDAEVFQPFSEVRLVDRVTGRLRSFGRLFLLAGFLSYPLLLIILGVVYGGLVFWGLFGVSMCVIWLVLTRTGYARNFEEWDSSLSGKLAAITVGFLGVMGFFLGLFWLRLWVLPIFGAFLALLVAFMLKK